jgi:hypothetical protein
MAKRQSVSPLLIEEALARQDEKFLELLRAFHDSKRIASIADRWARDHRPWARQKIIEYLSQPWTNFGHEPVIKRIFKYFESQRDDEIMGLYLYELDTYVRRIRRTTYRYDPKSQDYLEQEVLYTVPNWRTEGGELFKHRTRHYLRRRAWRYFRRMGFKDARRYPKAVAASLVRFEDSDLASGENLLDSWGLIHACFGRSDVIEFTPYSTRTRSGKRLGDLKPDPYFPKLWQADQSAEVLFGIVDAAQSRLVRVWAIELLRRWHAEALKRLEIEVILPLLDHPDGEVQQFGAELFMNSAALGTLPLETWLKLLRTQNLTALEMVVGAMEKHVTPERLSLAQLVEMACARPVPVARLALKFLRTRPIQLADRATIAGLSHARCDGAAADITRWALSILGSNDNYDPDLVIRFFDGLLLPMRQAAWEWLTIDSPGWNDSRLWSKLIESPYDDVKLKLVAALEHRKNADAATYAGTWYSVLLAVHRGGRTKLIALRQISDALRAHPEHGELLLPVLAVAIRSVRLPEARGGLAAIVSAVDARPELEPVVGRFLPELKLNAKAGAA